MRLTENFFELPNVVEDSNLPVHLPTQCSGPIGARGPLAPASSAHPARSTIHSKESYLGCILKVHPTSFCVLWNKYNLSLTLVLHIL